MAFSWDVMDAGFADTTDPAFTGYAAVSRLSCPRIPVLRSYVVRSGSLLELFTSIISVFVFSTGAVTLSWKVGGVPGVRVSKIV